MTSNIENEVVVLGNLIITPLIKAHDSLKKALVQASTELERDGAIQRFEFTYELFWKTLKKILKFKGIMVNNPRDVFRQAAKEGLIEEVEFWFEAIKQRNITTHIYSEQYSIEVFEFIPRFEIELSKALAKIRQL
ncbi:nucleotidyltransferase substrate binding protein [Candidatus Dependentiae bacterium]|nr:nucleotidyltransferase substrate binding protein [Candidatus Dependentiae bacterium]